MAYADGRSAELRRWIENNVTFPNTMVDRITPKTTEEDRDRIARKFGVADKAPVVCESFRQWVLEDDFAAGRPAWDLVGAQMTNDVAPYEKTKMRLLNGGHSAIGYAADLVGLNYIFEAAGDPLLRELLIQFMAEVRQTLASLPGIDLDSYSATIVSRFSNPIDMRPGSRICSNGCAKMAKFIVPSLSDLLTEGIRPRIIPVVLAAWLHYVQFATAPGASTIHRSRRCGPSLPQADQTPGALFPCPRCSAASLLRIPRSYAPYSTTLTNFAAGRTRRNRKSVAWETP